MPVVINHKKYYLISEIAEISGVKQRTLRRWINRGELDHFLHAFKGEGRPMLFRLDPPGEYDTFYSKEKNIFILPVEEGIS